MVHYSPVYVCFAYLFFPVLVYKYVYYPFVVFLFFCHKSFYYAVIWVHFRPEFLNRVDDIVVFRTLTEEHLEAIVEIQVNRLRKRLQERRIVLDMATEVKKHLARVGYDPVYGARPLKRSIQRELENPIAREILKGTIGDNSHVTAEMKGDEIAFRTEAGAEVTEPAAAAAGSP